jgi:hypothetical protein
MSPTEGGGMYQGPWLELVVRQQGAVTCLARVRLKNPVTL